MTDKLLRAARAGLGWSLQHAAEAAGVHHNTIYRAENGKPFTDDTLAALIETYARHGVVIDLEHQTVRIAK